MSKDIHIEYLAQSPEQLTKMAEIAIVLLSRYTVAGVGSAVATSDNAPDSLRIRPSTNSYIESVEPRLGAVDLGICRQSNSGQIVLDIGRHRFTIMYKPSEYPYF